MKPMKVLFEEWGLIEYPLAKEKQELIFDANVQIVLKNRRESLDLPIDNRLIFCEHPHVYTLGKSGSEAHLLWSEEERKQKNVLFFPINRGGDITYHGPGQLVGYPILNLSELKPDLHWYVRQLEETIIQVLDVFGLKAFRVSGLTGVWLGDTSQTQRKICAIGVRASHWISMHGFAFNISTDLSYFQGIVPCGIQEKGVTSLSQELGRTVEIAEVTPILKQKFEEVFGWDWA